MPEHPDQKHSSLYMPCRAARSAQFQWNGKRKKEKEKTIFQRTTQKKISSIVLISYHTHCLAFFHSWRNWNLNSVASIHNSPPRHGLELLGGVLSALRVSSVAFLPSPAHPIPAQSIHFISLHSHHCNRVQFERSPWHGSLLHLHPSGSLLSLGVSIENKNRCIVVSLRTRFASPHTPSVPRRMDRIGPGAGGQATKKGKQRGIGGSCQKSKAQIASHAQISHWNRAVQGVSPTFSLSSAGSLHHHLSLRRLINRHGRT